MMHPLDALMAQRGQLFPWVPVCMGAGVGLYFGLPEEPDVGVWLALGATCAICTLIALRANEYLAPIALACALIAGGLCLAGARAHLVSAPVLAFRYYGPVEGRIVSIDRSVSDKTRILLDRVILRDTPPARTPAFVRISLQDEHGASDLIPGMPVILTANLSPPAGPVEPGGFDFQRLAWFQRLGAVGYTRTAVLQIGPAETHSAAVVVHRLRLGLSKAVQRAMTGEEGAFAAALMTGDRSAMSQKTIADLRAANLAHLLAISGLHMGLLTAFIFGAVRYGLALIPALALRVPVKKIAAVVALAAAGGYLALSGGNVATTRAFVMVAVMLGAVLADRRALTLRAVAIAAIIILLLQPEALTGPGFQMSFAATTALVAIFGAMRGRESSVVPKILRPVLAVVISSAVAGAATAPIAAAHFNQIAHYGLLANLLSVPLMGTVVIPAAVLAVCLAPVGLSWVALSVMRLGLMWILGVADYVAGLDGALSRVISPPAAFLPLFAIGMLWLILWRGWIRWLGAVAVIGTFLLWTQATRPLLLIADTGGLVGMMTEAGRVLSKPKGDGFAASNWLENDGDLSPQVDAFERGGPRQTKGVAAFQLGPTTVLQLSGSGTRKRAQALCRDGVWIVSAVDVAPPGDCTLWTPKTLRATGALAFYLDHGSVTVISAKQAAGARLWNTRVRGAGRRRSP